MARYATGVSVVAAVHDGVRYGMTVNSLTSVSLDPTLMLFCCERDASLHDPLMAAGSWAVSVLSAAQQPQAALFATRGRPGVDQFDGQSASPGKLTGAPVLDGALAWFECRTWAAYEGGDHVIVVGEVLDLGCGDDAPGLLYFRSAYSATRD
jgi:flavin reductase (DIM6/NTAB) family NADH-FMN oxidoreductase RutF